MSNHDPAQFSLSMTGGRTGLEIKQFWEHVVCHEEWKGHPVLLDPSIPRTRCLAMYFSKVFGERLACTGTKIETSQALNLPAQNPLTSNECWLVKTLQEETLKQFAGSGGVRSDSLSSSLGWRRILQQLRVLCLVCGLGFCLGRGRAQKKSAMFALEPNEAPFRPRPNNVQMKPCHHGLPNACMDKVSTCAGGVC